MSFAGRAGLWRGSSLTTEVYDTARKGLTATEGKPTVCGPG